MIGAVIACSGVVMLLVKPVEKTIRRHRYDRDTAAGIGAALNRVNRLPGSDPAMLEILDRIP